MPTQFLTSSYQTLTGKLLWTQIWISNTGDVVRSIKSLNEITEYRTKKFLRRKACQCTCSRMFWNMPKPWNCTGHIENTPIQIYANFTSKNWKFSDKKSDIFHISAQNIDCGYSLEPPRRGCSNGRGGPKEYPQSMFFSRNKKNNVSTCKPQVFTK